MCNTEPNESRGGDNGRVGGRLERPRRQSSEIGEGSNQK